MGEVSSLGSYLPLLLLESKDAAAALRWSGLGGSGAGRRGVAAWDEDAVTLAVEAAELGYAKEYHVERAFREVTVTRIAPVTEQLIMSFIAEKVLSLPKS